jgi:hypothetical protein
MSQEKFKRCTTLPTHPNLQSGWACCNCRTFNGDQRTECKHCDHKRCTTDPNHQVN